MRRHELLEAMRERCGIERAGARLLGGGRLERGQFVPDKLAALDTMDAPKLCGGPIAGSVAVPLNADHADMTGGGTRAMGA